jgi:hypothetical protein
MFTKAKQQLQDGSTSECTTLEQHSVVLFLWAKGTASKNIHKEMLPI